MIVKKLVIFLIIFFLSLGLEAVEGEPEQNLSQLAVELSQIDPAEKGNLIIKVFYDEASWDDDSPNQKIIIEELKPELLFSLQLPQELDSLALQIIHDANKNGKMDFRIFPFPKPTEGIGLSNNYFRKGRPRFSDSEFFISESSAKISIEMNYF
jgi:uncharacterized protein (DUF2141 family)